MMKTPPSLDDFLNSALVSLTLLAFASLMLTLPVYRLAAAKWPESIVEQVYPDGRINLRESMPKFGDDGVVRSRPLNAARVEYADGSHVLGYVVAIRDAGDDTPRRPPSGTVWIPPNLDCELALKKPGQIADWIPCAEVIEISSPNRMHPGARLRQALSRALPDLVER